jgi:hypothetical protein
MRRTRLENMVDCAPFALAARLDPFMVPVAMQRLLLCQASSPNGFFMLQKPPLGVSRYCAARLVHKALETRGKFTASQLFELYKQNAKSAHHQAEVHDAAASLCALLRRAGVPAADVGAAVSLALWCPDVHAALDAVCGSPPYASLRKSLVLEVHAAQRALWGKRLV